MKDKNEYKEEKFDSFINKTIIMSSRTYFKKLMNINNKEKTIVDNEDYSAFLQVFVDKNNSVSDIDNAELKLEINEALKSLSAIEQSVIFLLYQEELSQSEAADILAIYSKTVSKIKIRAIEKLKKTLKKGDDMNE